VTVLDSKASPRDERFQQNAAQYDGTLKTLRAALSHSLAGGGQAHVARHHNRGKLLVRDRIDRLVDPNSPRLPLGAYTATRSLPPASSPASASSTARPAC